MRSATTWGFYTIYTRGSLSARHIFYGRFDSKSGPVWLDLSGRSEGVEKSRRFVSGGRARKEVFTRSSIICSETREKFNFRTFVDINSNKCAEGLTYKFILLPWYVAYMCVCMEWVRWIYLCVHTRGIFNVYRWSISLKKWLRI